MYSAAQKPKALNGRLSPNVIASLQQATNAAVSAATHMDSMSFSQLGGQLGEATQKALNANEATGGIGRFFNSIGDKLREFFLGTDNAAFKTRNVYDDPSDVGDPSPTDVRQATQQLQANQAAEQTALATLSTSEQQQYVALKKTAGTNVMAARALQAMLIDGRLTRQKDLLGNNTLLGNLATLNSEPLASGVDRQTVVTDVICEAENPVRIDQQAKGTCGATTATILLIRKDPAEYARLIAGVASPDGTVKLKGGATVSRVSDWQATNDGGRTMSCRLLQPALMNLGEFPLTHYDNTKDYAYLGPIALPFDSGLINGAEAKLDTQLTGQHYSSHSIIRWNRDSVWNGLKDALSKGQGPIPVSIDWNVGDGPGGHFVQVDKVENGQVYITNPWGDRETFSESEFKAHLEGTMTPS